MSSNPWHSVAGSPCRTIGNMVPMNQGEDDDPMLEARPRLRESRTRRFPDLAAVRGNVPKGVAPGTARQRQLRGGEARCAEVDSDEHACAEHAAGNANTGIRAARTQPQRRLSPAIARGPGRQSPRREATPLGDRSKNHRPSPDRTSPGFSHHCPAPQLPPTRRRSAIRRIVAGIAGDASMVAVTARTPAFATRRQRRAAHDRIAVVHRLPRAREGSRGHRQHATSSP
jgi:hypothetical protein